MKKIYLVVTIVAILACGCNESYRKTSEVSLRGENASWNPETGAITGATEFKHTQWGDSETKKIVSETKDKISDTEGTIASIVK